MTEQTNEFPLPFQDLVRLWVEYGARLHCDSIGDDGHAAIGADVAMRTACDAVAVGTSEMMQEQFRASFLDPERACEQIRLRAEQAVAKATRARAAAADRTAEIYAARFGIADPHASSGRA